MTSAKNFNRLTMAAWLGAIFAIGIVVAGCGPASQEGLATTDAPGAATPPLTVEVTPVAPPAAEPLTPATQTAATPTAPAQEAPKTPLEARIAGEKDLFVIQWLIQDYEQREEKPEGVLEALNERRDELVAEHAPQPAIEGLVDFVAFAFRQEENGKYTARWYFIVKEDVKEEWTLALTGKVDSAHLDKLPESDRESAATVWRVRPRTTQIGTWKKGEHRTLKVELDAQPIPYEMTSLFYQWFEDKPRVNGYPVKHGWQVAAKE